MKEILNQVLTCLGCLFIGSLLVFGANMFHLWCEKMKQTTKSDAFRMLIQKVDYVVQLCVEATNQVLVNDMKLSNNFDEAAKKAAFQQTMDSINTILTDEDKQNIIDEFGDLSTFIKNSVENYIGTKKDI